MSLIAIAATSAVILGYPLDRVLELATVLVGFIVVSAWARPKARPPYKLRNDQEFKAFKKEFRAFRSEVIEKLNKNQISHYSRKHQLTDLSQKVDALARKKPAPIPVASTDADAHPLAEIQELRALLDLDRGASSEQIDFLTAQVEDMKLTLAEYRLSLNAERIRQNLGEPLVPLEKELELIATSPLFDRDYYLAQAGDIPLDPIEHYVLIGSDLGYDPHPMFDSRYYRQHNLMATVWHRSILAHFLDPTVDSSGDPCLMFDTAWYNRQIGDTLDSRQAVHHYLEKGDREGLDPSPLFDTTWYRQRFGNLFAHRMTALAHYLSEGRHSGWSPNGAFDKDALSDALGLTAGADVVKAVASKLRELDGAEPERPHQPTANYWKWYNLATGRHREENTFALYRILGNDLPPRHQSGQTYANLKFILENEPDYVDCRKIWVLNRIVDPEARSLLVELLEDHGAEYIEIPIDWDEYRELGWNFRGLAGQYPSYGTAFDRHFAPNHGHRYREHIYHHKNVYLINNNGSRNIAVEHGRRIAKWVLPWDGNCFMTESAWDELRNYVTSNSHLRYVLVPMARLTEPNEVLLDPTYAPAAEDEPQIIFRADSEARFDPDFRYGHRPKVELFRRLGIPGNWDRWPTYSWDPEPVTDTRESNAWGQATWVARLYSGNSELEKSVTSGLRGRSRGEGLRTVIDRCDVELIRERFDHSKLFVLDDAALQAQTNAYPAAKAGVLGGLVDRIVASARADLGNRVYSVLDKTTTAPSRKPQDYWNPAPYWWPNPDSPDGLPYVKRDGQRVPGTILGEAGAEKYDRTALQLMIDETFVNALAHTFTGDSAFAEKAAAQIRTWFIDPDRRMNPHLQFAQVQLGHNGDIGNSWGILETKDFYYLLDAVRLIERSGELGSGEVEAVREWFGEFRGWLAESPQGRSECGAPNNHGTWYDVQVAAIDAFIGNADGLQETFRRTFERVGHQFAHDDGAQTEELRRTLTQHYCAYNLSGWLVLSNQAERIGSSLKDFTFPGGVGLREALGWIGARGGSPWQFEQIEPFDEDRFHAIGLWAVEAGLIETSWGWLKTMETVSPVFSVHDGIRPYWMVANPNIALD